MSISNAVSYAAQKGRSRLADKRANRLEEIGVVTRCEITTFSSGEIYDLPYDDDEKVQKLILAVSAHAQLQFLQCLPSMPL